MIARTGKPTLAICLATCKRPEMLRDLLESLAKVDAVQDTFLELRVVDNDAAGSARPVVHAIRGHMPPFDRVQYVIEPERNIAGARNAALNLGPADVLIFVDDDECVSTTWLVNLFNTCLQYKADVVLGPVFGNCPENTPLWLTRGGFFNKEVSKTGSSVDWKETRTSNTLVRGNWFFEGPMLRFDKSLGLSGGSDSDLFARMQDHGAHFVTCHEASVTEQIPKQRATFRWLWNRWYRNGLIYERIATNKSSEPHAIVRFLRRAGATLLLLGKGLPSALAGKPETCVRGLLRLSLGIGGLRAWIRPEATTRHVAYTDKSDTIPREEPVKVAFLTNIVSPYRLPVFSKLSETSGWDFKVFTDADMEFDRAWRTEHAGLKIKRTKCLSWKRTVKSSRPVPFKQVITLHCPIGLLKDLLAFRPRAVISLELGFRTAFASLYCALTGSPLIIWAYQSRISSTQGSWRLLWRRWLLNRASCVVGMGRQARDVLNEWGVPDEKIVDAPNAADHITLSTQLARPDSTARVQAIKKDQAGSGKMAIVVGRLIPLKGIEQMLSTWKDLPQKMRDEWQLVFIGDGPLKALIEAEKDPSISLAGLVPVDDMAYWYAAADLHIFPTCGDVWGLVVNEASTCGTPSLCSIHAGCYDDLIVNGENGLAIDFTYPKSASQLLEATLNRPDLPILGRAAQKHISRFTLDNMAEQFRTATRSATRSQMQMWPIQTS